MEIRNLTNDMIAAIILAGSIGIAVGGLGWNAYVVHLTSWGRGLLACSLLLVVAGLVAVAVGLFLRLRLKGKGQMPFRDREEIFGGVNLPLLAAATGVFLAAGWLLFIGIQGWRIAPCWDGLSHYLNFTHNATAAVAQAYNDAVQMSSVLAVVGGAAYAGAGVSILRREHPGLVAAALAFGGTAAVMLAYSWEQAVDVYTSQGSVSMGQTPYLFEGTVLPVIVFAVVALSLMAWQYKEFQQQ